MLGALEAKTVTALVEHHRDKWKPLHSAILDFLLAHRNSKSGQCCPGQETIARHCNVCKRTVQRYLEDLEAWGILIAHQVSSRAAFLLNQYEIRFALPTIPTEPAKQLELFASVASAPDAPDAPDATKAKAPAKVKTPERDISRPTPTPGRRRPVFDSGTFDRCKGELEALRRDAIESPERRRRLLRLGFPAELVEYLDRDPELERAGPVFGQGDFDARDWRKLQRELSNMREASIGARGRADPETFFRVACERAGISVIRGEQLYGRMVT